MKHHNEQNTINPETGEIYGLAECKRILDEALGPRQDTDGDPVNNWINGAGKEDYIWLMNCIANGEATPGHIKYIIRAAFNAGELYGRAKALQEWATSLPLPQPPPLHDEGSGGGHPSGVSANPTGDSNE